MEPGISYMGTKKHISTYVSGLVETISGEGPFLDLFAGMCSVSSNISGRPIWCNDAQLFATYVARLAYTTQPKTISVPSIETKILPFFNKNYNKLITRFSSSIECEQTLLSSKPSLNSLSKFYSNLAHVQNSNDLERERKRLEKKPLTVPWRLFSITYSGGYFGLHQCIEIDSIRYGIEMAYAAGHVKKEQYLWLLVCLAKSLSNSATTTGHFAQYLTVNVNNIKYYVKKRRRSIWLDWMTIVSLQSPSEICLYNHRNKVFNEDATHLLKKLASRKSHPEIIYADPPYTKDQYSRYYHIYDTLIKYNYPPSLGVGRYPPDRFRSKFSLKSEVENEFDVLIHGVKKLSGNFILSYPECGLVKNTKEIIYKKLKSSFKNVELTHSIPSKHSTMGASKGNVKQLVNELIFLTR